MIVVIADDLTGAAELGGIGLRYDYNVEIDTEINLQTRADLLIISTNTRSMKEPEAIKEVAKVTAKLSKVKPGMIFKKVDSVLRGHIIAELTVQLKELKLKKALLVGANPSLGRTIKDGIYYFNARPVHLSNFSEDMEFAVTNSEVMTMLRAKADNTYVHKNEEGIQESGITVGEVSTTEDFKAWARLADEHTLLAGASGFFEAVLDTLNKKSKIPHKGNEEDYGQPALFVCGSAFDKSREAIKKVKEKGGPVSYMPVEIVNSGNPADDLYQKWSDEIVALLSAHGKAIISIDEKTTGASNVSPLALREKTAQLVDKLFQKIYIHELLVEGGSTASAIIKKLGFSRFFPIKEITTGVIRMSVEGKDDLYLTLKPGSYDWPAEIWKF